MKLNEIKTYTFAKENKSPLSRIQLSPRKKDTGIGDTMEASEISEKTNTMGRGTAMTVLGLWRTRSLAERNTSELVITREDTTKHLVKAFHDFLGRQLEGNHSNVEFRGEIESARTALAFAYSLPKDDSLKVSRKIEDTFYR